MKYRIDFANITGPLADYLNNHKEFQLLDNNDYYSINDKEKKSFSRPAYDDAEDDTINLKSNKGYYYNNSTIDDRLTVIQFIKSYTHNIAQSRFDIKTSSNRAHFGKITSILSNFSKFGNKDITTKNTDIEPTTKDENISEHKLIPNNGDISKENPL